ncbi:unnamed protein product [Diabrotica balteata]|uniref:Uncharacterized protein n=1 Tax=Diabrotica balteata TaxID=107213 RepID=A0A9N9XEM6_DIABA|nr:unnamed protein product [Diabrotica balteata]
MIPMIKKQISSLEQKVEQLIDKISSLELPRDNKATNLDTIIQEVEESKFRENNIIIYNLHETNSSTAPARIEEDMKKVKQTLSVINPNIQVKKGIRLGNIKNNMSRPLKVVLENKNVALSILKNNNKLVASNIKINSDSTYLQRKYLSELRTNLADRVSKGEENLTIRTFLFGYKFTKSKQFNSISINVGIT